VLFLLRERPASDLHVHVRRSSFCLVPTVCRAMTALHRITVAAAYTGVWLGFAAWA
jgi:hypothetical protein